VPLVGVAKGRDRDAGRETFFVPGRPPFKLPPRDPTLLALHQTVRRVGEESDERLAECGRGFEAACFSKVAMICSTMRLPTECRWIWLISIGDRRSRLRSLLSTMFLTSFALTKLRRGTIGKLLITIG